MKFLSSITALFLLTSPLPADPTPGEWKELFNGKNLDGWTNSSGGEPGKNWKIVDGTLARTEKGGDIWTKERFGDFALEV